jgi:hypothetical protein
MPARYKLYLVAQFVGVLSRINRKKKAGVQLDTSLIDCPREFSFPSLTQFIPHRSSLGDQRQSISLLLRRSLNGPVRRELVVLVVRP